MTDLSGIPTGKLKQAYHLRFQDSINPAYTHEERNRFRALSRLVETELGERYRAGDTEARLQTIRPRKSRLESFGRGLGQGISFGFDDELSTAGRPRADLEDRRFSKRVAQSDNVLSFLGGELLGSILPAMVLSPVTGGASLTAPAGAASGIIKTAAGRVAGKSALAKRLGAFKAAMRGQTQLTGAQRAAILSGTAATEGAATGIGTSDLIRTNATAGDIAGAGVLGAAIGGVGGGSMAAAAPAVRGAGEFLHRRLTPHHGAPRAFQETLKEALRIPSPRHSEVVKEMLAQNPDADISPQAVREYFGRGGHIFEMLKENPDMVIGDITPESRKALTGLTIGDDRAAWREFNAIRADQAKDRVREYQRRLNVTPTDKLTRNYLPGGPVRTAVTEQYDEAITTLNKKQQYDTLVSLFKDRPGFDNANKMAKDGLMNVHGGKLKELLFSDAEERTNALMKWNADGGQEIFSDMEVVELFNTIADVDLMKIRQEMDPEVFTDIVSNPQIREQVMSTLYKNNSQNKEYGRALLARTLPGDWVDNLRGSLTALENKTVGKQRFGISRVKRNFDEATESINSDAGGGAEMLAEANRMHANVMRSEQALEVGKTVFDGNLTTSLQKVRKFNLFATPESRENFASGLFSGFAEAAGRGSLNEHRINRLFGSEAGEKLLKGVFGNNKKKLKAFRNMMENEFRITQTLNTLAKDRNPEDLLPAILGTTPVGGRQFTLVRAFETGVDQLLDPRRAEVASKLSKALASRTGDVGALKNILNRRGRKEYHKAIDESGATNLQRQKALLDILLTPKRMRNVPLTDRALSTVLPMLPIHESSAAFHDQKKYPIHE